MTSQTFTYDGKTIAFNDGETLAAAILRASSGETRLSYFCGIGNCQSCLVWMDERPVEACLTPAIAGANVVSRHD